MTRHGQDASELTLEIAAGGGVADRYSGTEETGHGVAGIAATYVVDTDGAVRYEQVAEDPADRTDGNWVRYFVRNDFQNVFGE